MLLKTKEMQDCRKLIEYRNCLNLTRSPLLILFLSGQILQRLFSCYAVLLNYVVSRSSQRWRQTCTLSIERIYVFFLVKKPPYQSSSCIIHTLIRYFQKSRKFLEKYMKIKMRLHIYLNPRIILWLCYFNEKFSSSLDSLYLPRIQSGFISIIFVGKQLSLFY